MLVLLALLSCDGAADITLEPIDSPPKTPATIAEAPPVSLPPGQAIVRQCWSSPQTEARARHETGKVGKKEAAPRPRPRSSRGADAQEVAAAAAPAEAPPVPPADLGAGPAASAASPPTGSAPTTTSTPAAEPMPDPKPASIAAGDDAAERRPRAQAKAKPIEPQLDWGATVWLSNDDSMSLASAQRVLWQARQGRAPDAREIRPHELLNYFSFQYDPVPPDRMFSVAGSAAKTGAETLSVALAVHGAEPPRKPLDLTLVVDVSGSMRAEGRMDYLKRGLSRMQEELDRGDRVDLVIFDSTACAPLEDFVVGRDDPSLLANAIAELRPRGGTNISVGLREAWRITDARNTGSIDRNRRVMLLTDAQVNEGTLDPEILAGLAARWEQNRIRLTGVGVGATFRDDVLDELTEKSHGAYVYLGSEAVVDRIFGPGFDSLTQTIAHDVRFALKLPPSLAMERFYGEESSTVMEDVQPINYYAGTTQLFLQDLRVRPGEVRPDDRVTLEVHYRDAATEEPAVQTFAWTVGELLGAPRHNLDKARALMAWSDFLMADATGGNACGTPLATYRDRQAPLGQDAEIAYVNSLVAQRCGVEVGPVSVAAGVDYKVKVDSDQPIAEVALACSAGAQTQSLSRSDTVARFKASPGACKLTLVGNVPMVANVTVPSTGGDVRCIVRGGALTCT